MDLNGRGWWWCEWMNGTIVVFLSFFSFFFHIIIQSKIMGCHSTHFVLSLSFSIYQWNFTTTTTSITTELINNFSSSRF